jgi:hypothetical protein
MVRDNRLSPFLDMVQEAVHNKDVRSIIEAMRIFGYINEIQYSDMNTQWSRMTQSSMVRTDGAETLELSRTPRDPEEVLPSIY